MKYNYLAEKIFVLPTDTLYGICTSYKNKDKVAKIYKIKSRDRNKPPIVLISKISHLYDLGVDKNFVEKHKNLFSNVWPGKVSIILPIDNGMLNTYEYLHRGTDSLAFRMPRNKLLLNIINDIGPIIAPSANPQDMPPASNVTDAKGYFGKMVDLYISGKKLKGEPSTIIKITKQGVNIVRHGAKAVQLEDLLT